MALREINTVADLHAYLYAAIQLEHATIPPYITAMYTMKPDTNLEAYNVIRVIVVEEMLHLTLAANILNAIGGVPDLTKKGFIPEFPTYLPNGEEDFEVNIESFSPKTIDNFLLIERPAKKYQDGHVPKRFSPVTDKAKKRILPTHIDSKGEEKHFYSIGEFYEYIAEGLTHLASKLGEKTLFKGDPDRQITPEYYYSGGGEIITVTDLSSALEAIRLISEQGEGFEGAIYDYEGELAHYYRFEQIKLGRYYHPGDVAGQPTGKKLVTDWESVYTIKTNPKTEDYPADSALYEANIRFNIFYKNFLHQISKAFDGNPQGLIPAIGEMFVLKNMAYELIHNPIPGQTGVYGAPTFEVDNIPEKEVNYTYQSNGIHG